MKNRRLIPLAAVVSAVALLSTACSNTNPGQASPSAAGTGSGATGQSDAVLTVGMPNGTQTNNQSPFAQGSSALSLGYAFVMYEPLMMINDARPADPPAPWLADKIEWNADSTEATITPHAGVKWSDGKDFTAADIAFSINLRKKFEGLNTAALPYGEVTTDGKTVKVGFTAKQIVNQAKLADLLMVPEHLWKDIKDPTKDPNLKPVGTGPYLLTSWTPQAATLKPNPTYWGGKPQVASLRYSSYNNNNALTTALQTGEAQWGWTFIADYQNVYIAKDPQHFKQWAAGGLGIDALFVNNEKKPFNDKAFRQALNMVIDRKQATAIATSGVNPPLTSKSGMPLPAGESFLAPDQKGNDFAVDVAGAKKVLTDAGYTYDGDTLKDKDGEAVTFTLTNPAGWNDYLTALDLIKAAAGTIGAKAEVKPAVEAAWFTDIPAGNFQATLHWTDGGATPWDMYSNMMDGAQYKAVGEAANWNFGRFKNDEATKALATFAGSTDEAARKTAMDTVQRVFADEVPALPIWVRPATAQYSTKNYVGWPSESDPYNQPQPTGPQAAQIVMKLKPSSS